MNEAADLLPDIANYCRQYDLLPDCGRIIVGLSGGPDSRVLLDLLIRMAADSQLTLVAAHLNHGLRGDASDQDEQSVREACAQAKIPLFVQHRRIADEAKALGLTIEETGRNARYAFFDAIALRWLKQSLPIDRQICDQGTMERMTLIQIDACLTGGIRIAVGHHRNDQAETVLMNLCRGSGLQGMVGMMPRNGLIVRPLLNVSRERIEQYAEMRNLSVCIDLSNTEPDATRNRIRHFVLPAIRNAFDGDAVSALARAANLLRDDADYLNRMAAA